MEIKLEEVAMSFIIAFSIIRIVIVLLVIFKIFKPNSDIKSKECRSIAELNTFINETHTNLSHKELLKNLPSELVNLKDNKLLNNANLKEASRLLFTNVKLHGFNVFDVFSELGHIIIFSPRGLAVDMTRFTSELETLNLAKNEIEKIPKLSIFPKLETLNLTWNINMKIEDGNTPDVFISGMTWIRITSIPRIILYEPIRTSKNGTFRY